MKLCCLETVWQCISDFEIHGREIDKFDFVNNSLSQIIGDGNKPLFCQNINLKQDPFRVSLEKFSGWEYSFCDYDAAYCSLTLRLVRVKYWGYSTKRVKFEKVCNIHRPSRWPITWTNLGNLWRIYGWIGEAAHRKSDEVLEIRSFCCCDVIGEELAFLNQ